MLNYSANCLAEDTCDTRYSLTCLNQTTTYTNKCGCLYYQYYNGSNCCKFTNIEYAIKLKLILIPV